MWHYITCNQTGQFDREKCKWLHLSLTVLMQGRLRYWLSLSGVRLQQSIVYLQLYLQQRHIQELHPRITSKSLNRSRTKSKLTCKNRINPKLLLRTYFSSRRFTSVCNMVIHTCSDCIFSLRSRRNFSISSAISAQSIWLILGLTYLAIDFTDWHVLQKADLGDSVYIDTYLFL